jgi:hypothetical protein
MTIWFYGDSWPGGCELEPGPDQTTQDLAFPAMVSKLLNQPVINKSVWGSSQEFMLEALLDSDVQPGDVAVFCCTVRTRRTYRTADNKFNDVQWQTDETHVNDYEDERVSAQTLALAYYMTLTRQATPYFFNQFDSVRYVDKMYNEIPDDAWLIPKNHSVLSAIFDPEYFARWDHHKRHNFYTWMDTENAAVKRYIRPSKGHPNLRGHQAIAEFVATELTKRGHYG